MKKVKNISKEHKYTFVILALELCVTLVQAFPAFQSMVV